MFWFLILGVVFVFWLGLVCLFFCNLASGGIERRVWLCCVMFVYTYMSIHYKGAIFRA